MSIELNLNFYGDFEKNFGPFQSILDVGICSYFIMVNYILKLISI